MNIDKDQIVSFLKDKGEDQKAKDADKELPQKVDPDKKEDANLLEKFGIDPKEMAQKFMGDKGIPGL